ncbi:hypothetical protein ACIBCB_16395 [Streptomyces uncialis]|uniref:hypothetical protein n=1 Tax=Streptomyces uncialis TaxID=1048205 RepID=UPI0037ADDCDA
MLPQSHDRQIDEAARVVAGIGADAPIADAAQKRVRGGALIGPRAMGHRHSQLAAADTTLSAEIRRPEP